MTGRPAPAVSRIEGRLILLFASLAVGLLLAALDQTIFATALPTIVGELGAVESMLWVNTAYLVAATVVMPVYGKLGDLLGRRVVFLAALTMFLLGSVVGGLAPTLAVLTVGRAIQGLGGGGLLILIQAIVADLIPARERAPYLSAIGAVFAVSALLGPVLGGWLTDGPGWRWAFWINVPLGALAIAAAAILLPRHPARTPVVVDARGVGALAVAVSATVLIASWGGTTYDWTSPIVAILGLTAALAIVGFILAERRAVEPVVPPSLFRDRNFIIAVVAGAATAVAMFGTVNYLPTALQMIFGLDARGAGLMMLTLVAGLGSATVGAAQVVARTGHYKGLPVLGAATAAAALAALATLSPDTDLVLVGLYLFGLGAGIGCGLDTLVLVVQTTAPPTQLGTATAANSFFREVGVSLGTAGVGALFTARLTPELAVRLPPNAGIALDTLTPERLRGLPPSVRTAVESAYADALTPVFLLLLPLMLLSLGLLLAIRPVPLARALPGRVR